MKLVKFALLSACVLLLTNPTHAQTADEIVGKYIDAIGGKEKLGQIKSLYAESSTEVMGNEAPGKIYMVNGKGYKSELDFNGQKIIQCFTDKGGWNVNAMSGSATPAPMPAEQYKYGKNQIYAGGPLYDYAAKGNKVELQGKEKNDYKLKITTADKAELTYYIDANTYYVSKTVSKTNFQGQDITVTITYSDYRKTDFGTFHPYKVETDLGQYQLTANITKLEINKDIDPKVFDQ